jgi:carboxypeptidase family protein
MLRKLSCFAAVLMLALPSMAATGTSSLSGIVRAPDGTPQMGAVVEVFASASRTLTTFTDGNGYYIVFGLRPGVYNLRVSAPSFLPAFREHVDLRSGLASVVNLTLTTIFATFDVVPRTDSTQSDDWQWTLRSVARRPILRAIDPGKVDSGKIEPGNPALTAERRDPVMKAGVSFIAGSDAQGYGGDADATTQFSFEHSVLSSGMFAFDGNVGYGETSPAAVLRARYSQELADGSTPEVSFTARRLAPPDPALRGTALSTFSLRVADSMNLADVIELKFGSELQTLQFIKRTSALLPFGSADVHLSPNTVVAYHYASSSPMSRLASDREALPIAPMQLGPRVSVNGFSAELQRGAHHELSLAHRSGKNNMMLAVYRDRLRDPALTGVGTPAGNSGEVLADPYSGTFTYQGADYRAEGVRAVYERKLSDGYEATLDYAYGGALEFDRLPANLESSRDSMHTTMRHAIAGGFSGVLPTCHTKWTASYKWTSGHALTPVDSFNASPGQIDPFLNLVLRQPIPRMGLLPAHMEALLDLHNLLAEGYVPVMGQDHRTVYLVQSARSVRGGVAITF